MCLRPRAFIEKFVVFYRQFWVFFFLHEKWGYPRDIYHLRYFLLYPFWISPVYLMNFLNLFIRLEQPLTYLYGSRLSLCFLDNFMWEVWCSHSLKCNDYIGELLHVPVVDIGPIVYWLYLLELRAYLFVQADTERSWQCHSSCQWSPASNILA